MPEDVTIGPLRCIVCGTPVLDLKTEWIRPAPRGYIYGLHATCTRAWTERGSWGHDGIPIIKPSLEQRVTSLENQLDGLTSRLASWPRPS